MFDKKEKTKGRRMKKQKGIKLKQREMKRKGNRNGRENERIERTKINKHKGKMKRGRDRKLK